MRSDLERVGGDATKITELHVDRGYTGAELTQQIAATPSAEVVSKPRPTHGKDGLFGKRDFKLDLHKKTATCPEGQRIPITLGAVARFDAANCGPCPRRAQCTTAADGKGRTLSIAADEPLQRTFAALVASSVGRERLRERVAIEHTIARHTQIQGKQARYRGIRKNLYDSRRIGALMNLECAQRELARGA
jgi:hypothetical protein